MRPGIPIRRPRSATTVTAPVPDSSGRASAWAQCEAGSRGSVSVFELVTALRAALFQETCPDALLRGHLVNPEAHRALRDGELEAFFERRRQAIVDAEKRWVEARGGAVTIHLERRTYAQG